MDMVEEVYKVWVCEWWEEFIIVEWVIVCGYEGCEMGYFGRWGSILIYLEI